MASLKIMTGSLSGQEIDLNFEPNVIGRASTNDVKIVDAGVSSKHAKIWAEEGRWFVMDLGSTNGTSVNSSDIDREELNDGDKIAFGPVVAVFQAGSKRGRPAAPAAAAPAPSAGRAAPAEPPRMAPAFGVPSGREGELELELSTQKARYATLEKEIDKVRQEAYEREKVVADQAVQGMKAEMEKLRQLMRERDESMRVVESQSKEREAWFSPEEVERERKRVEASVQLETRSQVEAFQRQVKELEGKVVARGAEAEALARSMREKDEMVRMLSEREDRAGGVAKERDDRIGQLTDELKRLQDDVTAVTAREREANQKLQQKNAQVAELNRAQLDLQNEISRARASAARVAAGGDAGGAGAQLAELTTELDGARQQTLKLRAELSQAQDELITARAARDAEATKSANAQKAADELHGQLTDLADEKTRLAGQVEELVRKHSEVSAAASRFAGVEAELAALKARDDLSTRRAEEAESQVTRLRTELLDANAARDAAQAKLGEIQADYKVLRSSRDESYDWEARYKSQVDTLDSLRKENTELRSTVEALEANAGQAAGTVDDATLTYARSRTKMLEDMAGGMLDGINNAVSLLRRNSEVLKGYVHDCGLLANCVRQINYTLLEPDQQRMLRELIDETQPDVIIRNMESIGEENADATNRAKRLILDYQDAMKVDEEGTDLERCFAKSQGLFKAVEPGTEIRVKVSKALPALPASQPEGVLFAFALLRESKRIAIDEDQLPTVRIDPEGSNVTMMISPVSTKAKERYRETNAGGGDALSQYVVGFAKQCGGRVDVKDMGDASTMFITLSAGK